MRYAFKPFFSRAMGLLGLVGLGFVQVGCAHPVVIEPSVSVHSRMGHFPVYAQVGVPGPVIYAPAPRVIYAPPPPPRVVYVPRVVTPVYGWGHERRYPSHQGKPWHHDPRDDGRGGRGRRGDERR